MANAQKFAELRPSVRVPACGPCYKAIMAAVPKVRIYQGKYAMKVLLYIINCFSWHNNRANEKCISFSMRYVLIVFVVVMVSLVLTHVAHGYVHRVPERRGCRVVQPGTYDLDRLFYSLMTRFF